MGVVNPCFEIINGLKKTNGLKKATGGLLIEVMVAAFILSFGILAIIRGQINGVNASRDAYHFLQAEFLMNDMVERILANQGEAASYAYDSAEPVTSSEEECFNTGSTEYCTPVNRKDADLLEWQALFTDSSGAPLLPGGQANIVIASGTATVTVSWDGKPRQNGEPNQDDPLSRSISSVIRY